MFARAVDSEPAELGIKGHEPSGESRLKLNCLTQYLSSSPLQFICSIGNGVDAKDP